MRLDSDSRNAAGEQALHIFNLLVVSYPKSAECWLWYGIALTETLRYSVDAPDGVYTENADELTRGTQAFLRAYELSPKDLVCVGYFGEALMVYRKDFDAAQRIWTEYRKLASTDLQKVTANVQLARACLNKAYFGKAKNTLSKREITELLKSADDYLKSASSICPNASDVREMKQILLEQQQLLLPPK